MVIQVFFRNKLARTITLYLIIILSYVQVIEKIVGQERVSTDFNEFKGLVIDDATKKPLEFASIVVNNTNISTITNIDGVFLLKIPSDKLNNTVVISYLGYNNRVIKLDEFTGKNLVIKMTESSVKLPNVSLVSLDPGFVMEKVLKNRKINYPNTPLLMNGFYRESIKKRRKYASLSEAVIDIYKQPFNVISSDYVRLYKARKSTDYKKIDTLVIKLQGGPYNNLNMDLIKNQSLFFSDDFFQIYDFTFDKTISMNNQQVYVIGFKQKASIIEPLFKGKLFIDAASFAIQKAEFSLSLENLKKASKYFVKKKPAKANVTPIHTKYIVDYRKNNGKWYFNYSRIELSFKVDWDKKLFNSFYHLTIEMAITDWNTIEDKSVLKNIDKLKRNIILTERASGFSDPEFWGKYNVIEPDKSIENAIKKIKKQLSRK